MDARHDGITVGKDDRGVYFMIEFSPGKAEKVYADEFFEDCIENGERMDVRIASHSKPRQRPAAFFDSIDPSDLGRIRKELDLREDYNPVRDDLNSYRYLASVFKDKPPRLEFTASSVADHVAWAKDVKETVATITGYKQLAAERVPLDVEDGPSSSYKHVVLKKYYITTATHLRLPVILAHPEKMDAPAPGIICLHGHNKGKINTIGMLESASNSYYGIELAMRGYVTLSLDQWGWGERKGVNAKHEDNPEAIFSLSALLLGRTAVGIRCWDVTRGIDFLQQLDIVAPRFGVIGQSGGGTTAAFSSVLDERIDAAIVSGYFCSWFASIFAMHHCPCNHVPGIMQHLELGDMMAARAPKPTFVVSGDSDGIFPQQGVQDAYEKVKRAYDLYGKPGNLGIDVILRTGHVFRGDLAYPWLDKVLGRGS